MKKIWRMELIAFAVLLFVFTDANRAYGDVFAAYIDPGTGSLIIQILLAALVGAGFGVKIFWTKIKTFFFKVFTKKRGGGGK